MSGIAVYVMVWTVVLFMVLPFRVKVPEKPIDGHATSAPENPYIWQKLLVTSLISLAIFLLLSWVISSEEISFRSL